MNKRHEQTTIGDNKGDYKIPTRYYILCIVSIVISLMLGDKDLVFSGLLFLILGHLNEICWILTKDDE